jgi:hypothetical protein
MRTVLPQINEEYEVEIQIKRLGIDNLQKKMLMMYVGCRRTPTVNQKQSAQQVQTLRIYQHFKSKKESLKKGKKQLKT